jgi:hypothetical protein
MYMTLWSNKYTHLFWTELFTLQLVSNLYCTARRRINDLRHSAKMYLYAVLQHPGSVSLCSYPRTSFIADVWYQDVFTYGYTDIKTTCLSFRMSFHVIILPRSVLRDAYRLRSLINSCRSLCFWMVNYSNIQRECAPDNVRGRSESNWRIVERENATSQVAVRECGLFDTSQI